jgi:GxxExxY protein
MRKIMPANRKATQGSPRSHGKHGDAEVTLPYGGLTDRIIGSAIEVHRHLGPGLLESAYEECRCFEPDQNGIKFARQVPPPIHYKGVALDAAYRMDIVAEKEVVIEIKATERLLPIHDTQMLTYLRLSGGPIGLIMNFNGVLPRDGLRRLVL